MINATPPPLYPPVPTVQEVEWAPRLVCTGAENLAPTGIQSSSFYYIPLYLTDMEQVNNIRQYIKHLSYHTLITMRIDII
jgi:hypothetical protein